MFYITFSECQKLEHDLKCSECFSPKFVAFPISTLFLHSSPSSLPILPFSPPSSSHSFPIFLFSLILSSFISQHSILLSHSMVLQYMLPQYMLHLFFIYVCFISFSFSKALLLFPHQFPKLRMPSHTPLPTQLTI